MPRAIRGPTADMFDYIGPEMPFGARLVMANRWLLGGILAAQFGATPYGNAMLRTTTAPTVLQAGVKENVLPSSARGLVNFRILPGDSVGRVLEHVLPKPHMLGDRLVVAASTSQLACNAEARIDVGWVFLDLSLLDDERTEYARSLCHVGIGCSWREHDADESNSQILGHRRP